MLTPSILNSCRRKTKAGKKPLRFPPTLVSCALLLISFLGKRKKQDTLIAIVVDVSQRVTER